MSQNRYVDRNRHRVSSWYTHYIDGDQSDFHRLFKKVYEVRCVSLYECI